MLASRPGGPGRSAGETAVLARAGSASPYLHTDPLINIYIPALASSSSSNCSIKVIKTAAFKTALAVDSELRIPSLYEKLIKKSMSSAQRRRSRRPHRQHRWPGTASGTHRCGAGRRRRRHSPSVRWAARGGAQLPAASAPLKHVEGGGRWPVTGDAPGDLPL